MEAMLITAGILILISVVLITSEPKKPKGPRKGTATYNLQKARKKGSSVTHKGDK